MRSAAQSFHSGRLCSFDWSQRFSHALKSSSRMTSDATQPIRCFTCIGSRRTLNPATVASPSVMSVRPVSNLIIVVLPAPFGPSRPKTVPEELHAYRTVGGLESAEALLKLLAAAPQVRLAFAGNPVGLATFLAAHGEVSFPQESPQGRIDGARTRLVEPVVPFLDRLDDLVPVHRAFLEQVQDETFEVALSEEMEEPPELLRGTHEASSRRRYQRIARTLPAIAYPAKTRREVAGSGMKPTSPPPGPGRTAGPPRAFAMMPDAEVGMNQGSTFARGRIPPMMLKIRVNRKNVRTVAATVPFIRADRRYATPTTAVMYPSV